MSPYKAKLSPQVKILWTLLSRGGSLKLGKMAEIADKSEKHLKYRVLPVMLNPKASSNQSDDKFSPMLKEVEPGKYTLSFYSDVSGVLGDFKKIHAKKVGWNDFQSRLCRIPTDEEKNAALRLAAVMGMEMGSKTVYQRSPIKTEGGETPTTKWRCPRCDYEGEAKVFLPRS